MTEFWSSFLDLLLPRSRALRRLEAMEPAGFRKKAGATCKDAPEGALVPFLYGETVVRQAIWELKYRGNRHVARLLAKCLYEELTEELFERRLFENFDKPLLIAVPLSGKRERERGWNQCELLAEELEREDGGRLFERGRRLLLKVRHTESQTKKGRADRLQNLKGCFAVPHPERVAGRNILLLDDVITTGATLAEASRTLRRAGARKILPLSLAH